MHPKTVQSQKVELVQKVLTTYTFPHSLPHADECLLKLQIIGLIDQRRQRTRKRHASTHQR